MSDALLYRLIDPVTIENVVDIVMILPEPVVFFNIYAYFPGARHAGRKRYQIPFADFHRFLPFGCYDNITFQKIAGFRIVI